MTDDEVLKHFINENHYGWGRMWKEVEKSFGSITCEHQGHQWRYMGTYFHMHIFKHNSLNGKVSYFRVLAKAEDFESLVDTDA